MNAAESDVEEPPVNQVAKMESIPPAMTTGPASMMDVIDRAISRGITGDDLRQLMDLQERWQANQAQKAFDQAMADAQGEMPSLTKNRLVNYASQKSPTGYVTYRHEDLAEVIETIKPVLKKFGLAHRFRTTQDGDKITVTCIITGHGHREENSLSAGRDTSGGKNNHQEIASAVTYLERYTLKAALGLAAAHDDDSHAAGSKDTGGYITDAQLKQLTDLAAEVGADVAKACRHLKIETLADLPTSRFNSAMAALEAKRSPL